MRTTALENTLKIVNTELNKINTRMDLIQNGFEKDQKSAEEKENQTFFYNAADTILAHAASNGSISQPLKQIASGLIMLGIGYFTKDLNSIRMGCLALASGVFSMFEENEDFASAHQEIMESLYRIADMIYKGFNQLLEQQALMLNQLHQLTTKVDRIEKILRITAKESYLKEYVTLYIRLNNYLYNYGVKEDPSEISKAMGDLQAWIAPNGHAYKSTVTGSVRVCDPYDPAYHAEILGDNDFDNLSMLGYMCELLQQLVPHRLTDPMKVKLPNLIIFFEAIGLYKSIIDKHHQEGNIAPIYNQIAQQLKMVSDYLSALLNNNDLWESLIAQINSYARQTNQYLAYLEKSNAFSKNDGMISEILPDSVERNNLMKCLDEIEIRRLLIGRFCEVLGKPVALLETFHALPSKAKFLARTRASLRDANTKLIAAGKKHDVAGVRAALDEGADYNKIIHLPSCLPVIKDKNHFVTRKKSIEILDMLLRHASPYNCPEVDLFHPSWPDPYLATSMCAINSMIGYGSFEQLILVIAQSEGDFEISKLSKRAKPQWIQIYGRAAGSRDVISDYSAPRMELIRGWQGSSNPQYEILLAILDDINNTDGVLNKKDLRIGYTFYRAVQDDNVGLMEEMLQKPVKPHIIVWLTALLGDTKPILELIDRDIKTYEDAIKSISYEQTTFLPLQLAVLLGHAKAIGVISRLTHYDMAYASNLVEPISGNKLKNFAIEQKFYSTAYVLSTFPEIKILQEERKDIQSRPESFEHVRKREKYTEEKTSLALFCASLSQSVNRASKQRKARAVTDSKEPSKLSKLIKENKCAEATSHIIKIMLPSGGMSEEEANSYLRGFARRNFVGVMIAKINSEDKTINDQLSKNLPIVLKELKISEKNLDVIQVAEMISEKLNTVKAPLNDEAIIEIIKELISDRQLSLPEEIITAIEAKLWERVEWGVKDWDIATQEKLISNLLKYLITNYGKTDNEDPAFCKLITELQKLQTPVVQKSGVKVPDSKRTESSNTAPNSGLFGRYIPATSSNVSEHKATTPILITSSGT